MNRAEPALLRIEVVYLRPGLAFRRSLRLPAPTTVGAAIDASGVLVSAPELAGGAALEVGVFGRPCATSDALRDGDRVEIYRPLAIDPKQARRIRAGVLRRRRTGAAAKAR